MNRAWPFPLLGKRALITDNTTAQAAADNTIAANHSLSPDRPGANSATRKKQRSKRVAGGSVSMQTAIDSEMDAAPVTGAEVGTVNIDRTAKPPEERLPREEPTNSGDVPALETTYDRDDTPMTGVSSDADAGSPSTCPRRPSRRRADGDSVRDDVSVVETSDADSEADSVPVAAFATPESDPKPKRPKKRSLHERRPGDTRPIVKLEPGQITESVNSVEDLLIERGGIFQHNGRIVCISTTPVIDDGRNDYPASKIVEMGEHALAEEVTQVACLMRFDKRSEEEFEVNTPIVLVKTLRERAGRLNFPVIKAIISAPTLRSDRSLLDAPGYDPATGFYLDTKGAVFPPIPTMPSRDDAIQALAVLVELLAGFPFVTEADRSVAISGIVTALVRPGLRTAPLHGFSATAAGTGKSKMVDIISVIATGREAAVMAQTENREEAEKQLNALLLEGSPIIALDNCTLSIDGNGLCASLTQSFVSVRPFGKLERLQVEATSFCTATGNNLVIAGDMMRRTVVCSMDAGMERPELRRFPFEPVERARTERGRYVAAALTILLAYEGAGAPRQEINQLGSFEQWSDLVRSSLIWIGCADPCAGMDEARRKDPDQIEHTEVVTQWRAVIGTSPVTVRELIHRATLQVDDGAGYAFADLRDALLAVSEGGGSINTRRLGRWLGKHVKSVVSGWKLEQCGERGGVALWRLRRHDEKHEGARSTHAMSAGR